MKIVLIGLGSIGLRHLRNLLSLGYRHVSVVSRKATLPDEFSFLRVYATLPEALSASGFDAALICTPTSLHLASLTQLLEAKIPNIYLEKPVSHSYEGIDEVIALTKSFNSKVMVGYDLHFDPGMNKVQELLRQNIIGKVVSVNAQAGQYLPDWRPAEDYTRGMSAKKEMGGGVMLDLIHEFDYLSWLFGPAESVACLYTNSGALQIETEDVCDVILQFKNGIIGSIHLDYLQKKLIRNCTVTGHHGSIFWNLANSQVVWIDKDKRQTEFNYKSFQRNDRFIAILKAFLEDSNDVRLTRLQDGLVSLQIVLAAKYSAENSVFVKLDKFISST